MSSVHNEWTRHENNLFEIALAEMDPNSPYRFEKIASKVPGKTAQQIQIHYQMLVNDIEMIESDEFPIPNYIEIIDDDSETIRASKKRIISKKELVHPMSTKGIPWTEEEHRMFLLGLKNCGKGDCRNISRNYVRSRTPTQVASHAQKHYLRTSSNNINSSSSSAGGIGTSTTTIRGRHPRPSIHDIRNRQPDDQHQTPVPKNNFIPIAPAPFPNTTAFSSSSFSSSSSTARTTTPLLDGLRRTSSLIPNSNFSLESRLIRSPKILNNIGNYGSSSYSLSTFMMSSAPHAAPTRRPLITPSSLSTTSMVPQQQYRPLQDQYLMTVAGAFYGGGSTEGYNNYYNNNINSGTTNGTCMLMNYQQAQQIQLGPTVAEPPAVASCNSSTGGGGGGGGGGIFQLGPTVAKPPATGNYGSSTGIGNGGSIFHLGPTVAEPPAATNYRSSTDSDSGGTIFHLGPTVAEPPPPTNYGSTGIGSSGGIFHIRPTVAEPPAVADRISTSCGGGVFHVGPAVAEPAAPNTSMDVDDNSTSIINHPYDYYDQPIYSPAYDPDMYPGYM